MNSPSEPLRVAIAARHLPVYTGGLASYQRGLAAELQRDGLEVRLVAAEPCDLPPAEGVTLPAAATGLGCHPPSRLWMSLASRPLFHAVLELLVASPLHGAWKRLAPAPPGVVHFVGTGWDFWGFGFARLARRCGARFTVWPAVHPGQWGDDRIDLRLYRMADAVFCQSRLEIDHLSRLGLPRGKAVLCGLPPMCQSGGNGAAFRAHWKLDGRPVVLFLGRRDAGKGFPGLLEAWRLVLEAHPSAVLVVAGPGDQVGPPARIPPENLIDLGVADEALKADVLDACDIFCLPSAHESFGIVYAEAWSYGKPVICGPAPASREWIEDGRTGLHSSQSPREIALAIGRLLSDPQLRLRLGAAGRELLQSRLTWQAVAGIHRRAFRAEG